jgi:hypothetical protein
MLHRDRRWCVHAAVDVDDLAEKLTNFTWATCQAFQLDDYLFLNDSTSRDDVQQYVILQQLSDGSYTEIETLAPGASTAARILEQLHRVVAGEFDMPDDRAERVSVIVEKPEQHGICDACR